jgi:hypothetical protein
MRRALLAGLAMLALAAPALAWLRENPHRFSLGRVSLDLRDKAGAGLPQGR